MDFRTIPETCRTISSTGEYPDNQWPQQSLDRIGKICIDQNSPVAIEKPGYLGAIQAFSLYEPRFYPVALSSDGPATESLEDIVRRYSPLFFYGVPNFPNPSGVTYSYERRREVGRILSGSDTLFIEDDAYGGLRFRGHDLPLVYLFLPDNGVIPGSFSKIITPGMRMGWIVAPTEIYEKLVTAKQAGDLHSNYLSQLIIHRFLDSHDIESHLHLIRESYHSQRDCMVDAMEEFFPPEVTFTRPDGGMFLWATLPEGTSSMDLFELSVREKVAFEPEPLFYTEGSGSGSLRLNYSNAEPNLIIEGIRRLGDSMNTLLG